MLAFNKTNKSIERSGFISIFFENIRKWYVYITKKYIKNYKDYKYQV